MTSGHLIFIPAVLAVGMLIGFLLGTRAAQDRLNLELKRQAEREEARRKRAERKAGEGDGAEVEVKAGPETRKPESKVETGAARAEPLERGTPLSEAPTVKARKEPRR